VANDILMGPQPLNPRRRHEIFWVGLSLVVLGTCSFYAFLAIQTQLRITLDPTTWKVNSVAPCSATEDCFQIGDQVLSIGEVSLGEYSSSRNAQYINQVDSHGMIDVTLVRQGAQLRKRLKLTQAGSPWGDSLNYFLPFVFWLMGTGIILFLRPRDERWLMLILFAYITALWFSSGLASQLHRMGSAVVFHVFIWLFFPVTVHLHLVLPNGLLTRRARAILLSSLYLFSLVLILLDAFYFPGRLTVSPLLSVASAVVVALLILLIRFLFSTTPAERTALQIMLAGSSLGLGTFLVFFGLLPQVLVKVQMTSGVNIRELYPWILVLAQLPLPLLPMSYIYALYKHHLGTLEFRPNRFFGRYSFLTLSTTLFIVSLFVLSSRFASLNLRFITAVIVTSLLFLWGALLLRERYQALIDRYVFGIKHSPDEIIRLTSDRIPQAFDRSALAQVVTDEVLPALLVRQSALYLFRGSDIELVYEQGLYADTLRPSGSSLRSLLDAPGLSTERASPERPGPSWVHLVVPLSLQGRDIGVWLLGRRDPDDYYPLSDIRLIETVGNQIAPVLENIRLYEQAQQEIAQRKAAEIEIRRSEERFRTLFEATLEGIVIVRDGVILEVNEALSAIFGHAPSELIGRRLTEVISAETNEPDGVTHEGKGLRKDGSSVDVEIAGKKFVLQGEDVTVVAVRDIAGRKRDEAENKMLQRQLLHSQKMEAIGRLSAGVAHDFNNCLLAIFGYTDLLRETYPDDPFLARNLAGLKEAGQKAASLTKQLLAFARRQPMEARIVDLNPVVSGLEKMLRRLLGEDVTLLTELEPNLGKVKVDPGQLEQIILNLAVNARDAMPEGGRLTVRTSAVTIDDETRPGPYASVKPGTYALLSVTDTGMGMDAETQGHVFEPFFSTKGEGTGLGLSTAYGIVQQSRGHILVESAPQRGAVFSIFLPVTEEVEIPVAAPAGVLADRGDETILLVEDEEEVRPVLEQILSGRGYHVLAASSGPEALRIAAGHAGLIHLLLTDVTMPRMKGTELASRLLLQRPATRVVYMSGYNEEGIEESGKICLQKPFSPVTLAQTLRAVLDAPAAPA
jgi:PAS domain S-box-containing protein